jgi:hypothetical protein
LPLASSKEVKIYLFFPGNQVFYGSKGSNKNLEHFRKGG